MEGQATPQQVRQHASTCMASAGVQGQRVKVMTTGGRPGAISHKFL